MKFDSGTYLMGVLDCKLGEDFKDAEKIVKIIKNFLGDDFKVPYGSVKFFDKKNKVIEFPVSNEVGGITFDSIRIGTIKGEHFQIVMDGHFKDCVNSTVKLRMSYYSDSDYGKGHELSIVLPSGSHKGIYYFKIDTYDAYLHPLNKFSYYDKDVYDVVEGVHSDHIDSFLEFNDDNLVNAGFSPDVEKELKFVKEGTNSYGTNNTNLTHERISKTFLNSSYDAFIANVGEIIKAEEKTFTKQFDK